MSEESQDRVLGKDEGLFVVPEVAGEPLLKDILSASTTEDLFGSLRGKMTYSEDLTTSTTEEWKSIIEEDN